MPSAGLRYAALIMILALCAPAMAAADALRDQFRDPPAAARPRVWWHWMNGNVTREGIRRDLDWMKQVGIGGAGYTAELLAFRLPRGS